MSWDSEIKDAYAVHWIIPTGFANKINEVRTRIFKREEDASDFIGGIVAAYKILEINHGGYVRMVFLGDEDE